MNDFRVNPCDIEAYRKLVIDTKKLTGINTTTAREAIDLALRYIYEDAKKRGNKAWKEFEASTDYNPGAFYMRTNAAAHAIDKSAGCICGKCACCKRELDNG